MLTENARNLEKSPIEFPEEDGLTLETIDEKRSPGMMLEDRGEKVRAVAKLHEDAARRGMNPGKLDKVLTGNYVAYVIPEKAKECAVGKITAISRIEATVIVHRYRPVSDNHMRLHLEARLH